MVKILLGILDLKFALLASFPMFVCLHDLPNTTHDLYFENEFTFVKRERALELSAELHLKEPARLPTGNCTRLYPCLSVQCSSVREGKKREVNQPAAGCC